MNKQQNNVLNWMDTFGQECPAKAGIPSLEIRKLRAKLILEEALETICALGISVQFDRGNYRTNWLSENFNFHDASLDNLPNSMPNLTKIADGIADLNYVSYGTAIACGLDMEPIENEVHKNNMSKLWSGDELASEFNGPVLEQLKLEKLPAGKYKGLWIVKDKHGKILKPPGHSKPNLEPLIKQQE